MATVQLLYSQTCTQCDNTGDPPGNYASETGIGTTADGEASFAGGFESEAIGAISFSFGNRAISEGTSSVALGQFVHADALNSVVIGTGASLSSNLTNEIPRSLMIGFGSEKSTLFIGPNGPGLTGKVGIGDVTDPQAKLHIKADDNEDARLFIEPHAFSASDGAELWLGTENYGLRAIYGKLYFNTLGNYLFNSSHAKVGIGIDAPQEKLEVNGNIKQSAGFYLITDKVKASDASGLKLQDKNGDGLIVKNGKIGIGLSGPVYNLDVNGVISTAAFRLHEGSASDGYVLQNNASGDAHWVDPMTLDVDDGDWTSTGSDIYRATGNVGIGVAPGCLLHIDVNSSYSGSEFFKVADITGSAGGTTIIGRKPGNGPILKQIAGPNNFSNGGPALNIEQIANNGEVGLGITTFTKLDHSVDYSSIFAPNSNLYLISSDDMIIRTGGAENEVYFKADGRVGIGKVPDAGVTLDVDGSVNFTNANLDEVSINDEISIGSGIGKLYIGSATGVSTGWGTSYVGFNAHRYYDDGWKWQTKNDDSHNGGGVIYSSIGGDIVFACINSTGATNQVIDDSQLMSKVKLVISAGGVVKVKELEVESSIWSDKVFEDNYNLPSLKYLESYISFNKHLPDIPSEQDVIKNGINVGNMNALLLKKIEELTLYIIQQDKKITTLEQKVIK